MMKRTRKQYPSALKAKIVLEVLRETKTIAELASAYQIHPNLYTDPMNPDSGLKWLPTTNIPGKVKDSGNQAEAIHSGVQGQVGA